MKVSVWRFQYEGFRIKYEGFMKNYEDFMKKYEGFMVGEPGAFRFLFSCLQNGKLRNLSVCGNTYCRQWFSMYFDDGRFA